jgi:predicted nucleic-acid-binding protein
MTTEQAKAAAKLIEQACSKNNPGHINHIVLCEIVRVLRRNYKLNIQYLYYLMGWLKKCPADFPSKI